MGLIKRKISLASLKDLNKGDFFESKYYNILNDGCNPNSSLNLSEKYNPNPNYGNLKPYIYFTIPIFQDYNNIGIYDDYDFTPMVQESDESVDYIVRKSGIRFEKYLTTQNYVVAGQTESRLSEIDYYGNLTVNKNYSNDTYSFTGALQKNAVAITYIINGSNNNGYLPNTGIKYKEYFDIKRVVFDDKINNFIQIPLVEFSYSGQGWNENNTSLKELVKDDILFGIDEIREVESELEIDRGNYSVFENHYILGEINTLEDLTNYRNNFFKL